MLPRWMETRTVEPARTEPPPPRRRRGTVVAIVLAVLVVAGLVVGCAGYYRWCKGASGDPATVTVRVPKGASAESAVELLHRAGVVRCGGVVGRVLLQASHHGEDIRAGTYELRKNMTLEAALAVLSTAPKAVKTVSVTIPEGYRLTQIASTVHQHLGLDAGAFLREAQSGRYALEPYLPKGTSTSEGFLFPNTYEFATKGLTSGAVITRLLEQFGHEVAHLPWGRAKKLGVTPYQVVTIASMIEREAAVPSERALIAAVIYNRLAKNMTLGIDATLEYVDPDPSNGLTQSDLAIDSPYNTRLHRGLPPTPIANPGLASIKAALAPADSPDLYYVLCGQDGHHRFSVGYQQFLADKAACLG
jgi:peptidoglycan lytic transglycosylase G